ncbi:YidC/Oxa1 family membrane protein insertase, partial [Bacillus velezensis]|uniref:YidC/Oxa1 family membrane protein insertase n=1 Tax=Bacillus velezensis TaxID=492670 RepID=UPI0037C0B91A
MIILTILIPLLILPLIINHLPTSKPIHPLHPQIHNLTQKYTSKHQKTHHNLHQQTIPLFSNHPLNPLPPSFPILIQIPIFIPFYHPIIPTQPISHHTFLSFHLPHNHPYYILPILPPLPTFLQH